MKAAMTSALEFATLVGIGLVLASALLALRGWGALLLQEPWWKARRKGAQVRLFETLMESDLLAIEKMPSRHGSHGALRDSGAWLARARWIQTRWLPELDVEMADVLDSHSGLLMHLVGGPDGHRVPGGPLRRTVSRPMAYEWARLRYIASLERLAASCTDVSEDVARLEHELLPQEPIPFPDTAAFTLSR